MILSLFCGYANCFFQWVFMFFQSHCGLGCCQKQHLYGSTSRNSNDYYNDIVWGDHYLTPKCSWRILWEVPEHPHFATLERSLAKWKSHLSHRAAVLPFPRIPSWCIKNWAPQISPRHKNTHNSSQILIGTSHNHHLSHLWYHGPVVGVTFVSRYLQPASS